MALAGARPTRGAALRLSRPESLGYPAAHHDESTVALPGLPDAGVGRDRRVSACHAHDHIPDPGRGLLFAVVAPAGEMAVGQPDLRALAARLAGPGRGIAQGQDLRLPGHGRRVCAVLVGRASVVEAGRGRRRLLFGQRRLCGHAAGPCGTGIRQRRAAAAIGGRASVQCECRGSPRVSTTFRYKVAGSRQPPVESWPTSCRYSSCQGVCDSGAW